MYAWESIQKAIEEIELHITEEIKIEQLANIAGLSVFYFQRLFKRLVGKTIQEYIKLRKMANASKELRKEEQRIIDIAMEFGFSSHANFTRVFKETYGITPEKYRENPVILNQFVKPDLLLNYVEIQENMPIITQDMVIEIMKRKLNKPRIFMGIEREVPIEQLMGGNTTGIASASNLWSEFHKKKKQIPYVLKHGNELGALYMADAKQGNCMYMAAAEVEKESEIEGFTSFTLPKGEYVVCGYEAPNMEELYGSAVFKAQTFIQRWMETNKLTPKDFATEMYYPPRKDAVYLENWFLPITIRKEGSN